MTSNAITDSHGIDTTPGIERQRTVADEGVGNGRIEHGGVGAEQTCQTTHGGERTQRDDEGRQAQQRDQRAIDDTEAEAGEHRDRQPERPEIRKLGDRQSGHRGRGQDGADRQVDAAGEDDEGHACGQHGIDRGLLQNDAEVLAREETALRQKMKADAQQQQHRQHADRADQQPYALTPRLLRGRGAGSRGGGGFRPLRRTVTHRAAPSRWRAP